MRIQHNIPAMSAYRNYTNNNSALAKNLEKLSSGYKINRAGDDAAGLAISEKMRAQISGLEQAQANAKDGISLVQTAEGALTEVHDMLNRMVTLAEQSANGTYDNETDRTQLQKELDQLRTEIDRIADSANFNGIKLLDGSLDSSNTGEATVTQEVVKAEEHYGLILSNLAKDPTGEVGNATVLHADAPNNQATQTSFSVDLHNYELYGNEGDTATFKVGNQEYTLTFDSIVGSSNVVGSNLKPNTKITGQDLATAISNAFNSGNKLINGQAFTLQANGSKLTFTQAAQPQSASEEVSANMEVTLQLNRQQVEGATEMNYTLNSGEKTQLTNGGSVMYINSTKVQLTDTDSDGTWTGTVGNFDVSYDSSKGKLTVKNINGGVENASVKIGGSLSNTTLTAQTTADGTAATAGQVSFTIDEAGATASGFNITIYDGSGNACTINKGSSGSATTISADTSVAATAGYTVKVGDYTYDLEYNADTGAVTLSCTDPKANGQPIHLINTNATISGTKALTGKDFTDGRYELEMSDTTGVTVTLGGQQFSVSGATSTFAKTIESDGVQFDVSYDEDNDKLVLTAKDPDVDLSSKTISIEWSNANAASVANDVSSVSGGMDGTQGTAAFNATTFMNAVKGGDTEVKLFINGEYYSYDQIKAGEADTNEYRFKFEGNSLIATTIDKGDQSTSPTPYVIADAYEEKELKGQMTPSEASGTESGTWNVKTTENVQGKASSSDVLASTKFQLTKAMVTDEGTLTIGEQIYTFKVGKDSKATGDNVIDLSDLEADSANLVQEAAQRLTYYCKNGQNNFFTVGDSKDDKGNVWISLHEKSGADGKSALTKDRKEKLDSYEEFDKLVSYKPAKDTVIDNVDNSTATGKAGKALTLQIGDTAEDFNQLKVDIMDCHVGAMGEIDKATGKVAKGRSIKDINIGTQDGAQEAVDVIRAAINYVSDVRGTLGATQNRLDHTMNNLAVMEENIQDAESTIRDVDVAKEMMEYTKNNILVQSAQAMLAQANQLPQGVLQLLQ